MKEVTIAFFFDNYERSVNSIIRAGEVFSGGVYFYLSFDVNTTYEKIIRRLVQEEMRCPPLDSQQLRYNLILQVFETPHIFYARHWQQRQNFRLTRSLSKPVTLREGQTLASTQLTNLAMDVSEETPAAARLFPIRIIWCAISIEIKALSLPKEKPNSTSPNWGQVLPTTIGGVLGFLFGVTANAASIIGGLDVIEKRWREWHSPHHTNHQLGTSHLSDTDIIAIRLRMTQGPDHEFVEWLTDPDRLKIYIEAFKASSIKPLQAIFVQRNDKAIPVDILEGAQNNLALDALLSYLKIDPAEKG